jgi:hypothetical protein
MKKTLALVPLIILSGCVTITQSPTKVNDGLIEYNNELNFLLAKMNEAAQVNFIEYDSKYYQAYDATFPDVSPVFYSKDDAQEYALANNFNHDNDPTGHQYVVREVSHRFEVRLVNDAINDILYTSPHLREAKQYLNEYKTNHDDLVIYDLVNQVVVGINTQ